MRLKLESDEYIVTSWAENCSGPGWSNQVVWVLICSRGCMNYRIESLQPDEQSVGLKYLFNSSSVISKEMLQEVERMVRKTA